MLWKNILCNIAGQVFIVFPVILHRIFFLSSICSDLLLYFNIHVALHVGTYFLAFTMLLERMHRLHTLPSFCFFLVYNFFLPDEISWCARNVVPFFYYKFIWFQEEVCRNKSLSKIIVNFSYSEILRSLSRIHIWIISLIIVFLNLSFYLSYLHCIWICKNMNEGFIFSYIFSFWNFVCLR